MFHARCEMFQEGYGQWHVCWSIFTPFPQLMSGMSGASNKPADVHLWRIGKLLILVPMFLKISLTCLGHLQRGFLERMLPTKGVFERRQNLHSWYIRWICYIRWAPFKKANLRDLLLMFGSEILSTDLIPLFGISFATPKNAPAHLELWVQPYKFPHFRTSFFSTIRHQMLNIKEFDGKNAIDPFARKFLTNFAFFISWTNAFRLNPQPKRRELFYCDAR